jgi:hypothetical protein
VESGKWKVESDVFLARSETSKVESDVLLVRNETK